MKKNKGFTLVELLAVIVILAVIALIATPVVLSMIESSRKGAAESSMLSYVDATEKTIVTALMSNSSAIDYDQRYTLDSTSTLTLNAVNGDQPCIASGKKAYETTTTASDLAALVSGKCDQANSFVPNSAYDTKNSKAVSLTVDLKGDQPDATAADSVVLVSGNIVTEAKLKFSKYYVSYFYDRTAGTSVYCSNDTGFVAKAENCPA